jgi:predicted ferric reductase
MKTTNQNLRLLISGLRIALPIGVITLLGSITLLGLRDVLGSDIQEPGKEWVLATGRLLGLWTATLLLFQPLLSLRWPKLESILSLDQRLKIHRILGIACLALAFLHPLFVFGSTLRTTGSWGVRLWPEGLGLMALIGLWFVVISSTNRSFLLLSWELWQKTHFLAVPVIGLILAHLFCVSPGQRREGLLIGWITLLGLWACSLTWLKTIRPITYARRNRYQLEDIRIVAHKITELTVSTMGRDRIFSFEPGQYAFLRWPHAAVAPETHPFTIASPPVDQQILQFAIKASGDFTENLAQLKPGDIAQIDGPYGRFTLSAFGRVRSLVMVAGGIGVTPMLSILRSLARQEQRPAVTLIWSNRTGEDIPYREELDLIQKQWSGLSIHYILTQDQTVPGAHYGRLDQKSLQALVPDYQSDTHVMLCGPYPMIRDLSRAFRRLGYPRRIIHYETFAL